MNVESLAYFFSGFLADFCCFGQFLQKLDHVLSINVKNILDKLSLKSLTVFIDVLGEIKGQLVDHRHASFQHIKYLLSIPDDTFIPINTFHPFNDIGRIVDFKFELFSDQLASYSLQTASDG